MVKTDSKKVIKRRNIDQYYKDVVFSMEGSLKLAERFERKCPKDDLYINRLAYELNMINKKGFVEHFLLAREVLDLTEGIPHITRGSCGSSLVSYLLGISNIDPVKEKISFSRFINEHRTSMPDIDFDFPHKKRDEVFERIHEKWGNKVARISNHIYYKEKSALRQAIRDQGYNKFISKSKLNANIIPGKREDVIKRKEELLGTFRQYSLHCGGVIFYDDQVPDDLVLERSEKQKTQSIKQVKYNKDDVEDHGKLKLDVLSNRGLSQLFDISDMPLEDYPDEDFDTELLLSNAKNIGLTFAESPIMHKTIASLEPTTIKELATCLAIIRPAAASGGRKTAYIKNALNGQFTDALIFDDDAIRFIREIINCDDGMADKYRRSFAKRKLNDMLYFECVISDMDECDDIIDNLTQLRKYSFCKSHAYSYAQLVWALAYQKAHNPKKFWVSTLNNCRSMYRTWVHFSEAKTSGIKLTLGKRPWKLIDNKLVGHGKDKNRHKLTSKASSIEQFLTYGYWTSQKFLPNMYVKVIDEYNNIVRFRGLIATGRTYRNRTRYGRRRKDGSTFLTIGYKTGHFIDVTIHGIHKFSWADVISGKGYVKQYIDGVDYLSIDAFEYKFEKIKSNNIKDAKN